MDPRLATALILFLGSFIQGLTGFGQALVAIPLLVMVIDIREAVPLCMLNGLIITGFLSLQLKEHVDRRKITPLLIGCLPGIGVGIYLLTNIDAATFKLSMGIMLIAYSMYNLTCHPQPRKLSNIWAYLAGFGTGAISAAFSAGGPPAIIYTTLTGWSKDQMKATLSVFFFLGGIAAAMAHLYAGLTTISLLKYLIWTIPAVISGVFLGSRLYRRFKTREYIKIVLCVLILMGVMMIRSAFIA
ncbi:MAG: sulfite exporter TauE/SafE family protein [Proteobacteria bacterium]|nr:sulfite exporter TauE/SafE family protein [Pseudomonadota bacterium]MBU1715519.1 sulfite exporter TauE/SafE family protein [Pseudomonadota bacterium]